MTRVCVQRCVCFDVGFDELGRIAQEKGITTLEELQEEKEFGISCRLCNPYVRRMLMTGQVVFHELIEDAPPPEE